MPRKPEKPVRKGRVLRATFRTRYGRIIRAADYGHKAWPIGSRKP